MPLLDLPPEILQQPLLYCTTPSFFHAIRTCKAIFQVAGSSRAVLLHHLEQVPGITLGLQCPTISTDDLFLTLRRRGAAHFFGSNITADCINVCAGYGTIEPNASCLADNFFALALKDSLRVRLYEVEDASCKLKCESAGGLAPLSGVGKVLKVVIELGKIHTLFSYSPRPSAGEAHLPKHLKSCRRPIEGDLDHEGSAMVDTELSSLGLSDTCYYVAVGEIFSNGEIYFQIPAPPPWLGRMLVPIDLAVYGPLQCAVLWDLPESIKPSIFAQVIKYTAPRVPEAGATAEYMAERIWPLGDRPNEGKSPKVRRTSLNSNLPHSLQCKIPPQPQPLPGRLARVLRSSESTSLPRSIGFAQHGRRIKFFAPGGIVPYHVAGASPESHRSSEVDDEPSDPFRTPENPWIRSLHNLVWNLTTPFYNYHATRLIRRAGDDADDSSEVEKMCTTSYLSLASTNVSRDRRLEAEVLCVIRATKILSYDDCTHLAHTDRCTSLHHGSVKVVARLWGWQPSKSSLAGEQNVAYCDTRIAIAEWDRVFIWSLDPRALLDEADDLAPPESSTSDHESDTDSDASVAQPAAGEMRKEQAWTYPRVYDAKMEAWYVELKPIILSASKSRSTGGSGRNRDTVVIRQLVWKDTNTLVVRTDRGLQIWNLGPRATGKRTQEVLEMDTPQQLDCKDFDDWRNIPSRGKANVKV